MVLVFYATVSRWLPGVRSMDLLVTNSDLPPNPPFSVSVSSHLIFILACFPFS